MNIIHDFVFKYIIFNILTWHHGIGHLPTTAKELHYEFSTKYFMVILLINFTIFNFCNRISLADQLKTRHASDAHFFDFSSYWETNFYVCPQKTVKFIFNCSSFFFSFLLSAFCESFLIFFYRVFSFIFFHQASNISQIIFFYFIPSESIAYWYTFPFFLYSYSRIFLLHFHFVIYLLTRSQL